MATKSTRTVKVPLVAEIMELISRYVTLPREELLICAHYVLHTHQFSERCQNPVITPYLYVFSAEKRSGKTRLGIEILGCLCRNFEGVNNITSATMFRLASTRCTLAIDEVDTYFTGTKSNDDTVGTMNTGYRLGGYVPRFDPKKGEIVQFSTFCPKIFVGIDNGLMKDTTRDRCIPIHMHRQTQEESAKTQPFYHYRIENELADLNGRIYDWSLENTEGMRDYDPEPIPSIADNDRQVEVSVPLLQVAKKTGYEKEMREAIAKVFEENAVPENTPETDMLLMIQELFDDMGERVSSEAMLLKVQEDERFRSMTKGTLNRKLQTFGIKSKTIRFPTGPARGYERSMFLDAWERYC